MYVIDATVDEADGTLDVIVALSHRATTASTVDIATSDDTATSGSDYTALTQTVTIPASTQTATVPVTILDDTDDETYKETFTVTMSNAGGGAVLGTSTSGIMTILDDDYPPNVSVAGESAREGTTSSDNSKVYFTVSLDRAVTKDVTVTLNTADGTATAGSDYVAVTGQAVTISAGRTDVRTGVEIIEDSTVEPDETFTLTVSAPVNAEIGTGTATGTIVNDDPSGRVGACTVDPVTGDYTLLVDGLASVDTSTWSQHWNHVRFGQQWTDPHGTVFAGGTVTGATPTVTVGVTYTHTVREYYRETRLMYLSGQLVQVSVTLSRERGTATAVCTTPPPEWQVSVADWSADEDAGYAYVTISLNRPADLDMSQSPPAYPEVSVTLDTADGTATSGDDYTAATAETVTIPGRHLQTTVRVPIIDDTVNESDETFTVTISNPAARRGCIGWLGLFGTCATPAPALGDDTATVTIIDNEISVDIDGPVTAVEGLPLTFEVQLSEPAAADFVIGYTVTDVTTTAGDDYTVATGQVTVAAGATSATFDVATIDDSTDEPDETLEVTLTWANGNPLGAGAVAVGTIEDNDNPPSVSVVDISFDEDDSVVLNPPFDLDGDGIPDTEYVYSLDKTFTVELDNPSAFQVTVDASTVDGTATGTTGSCPQTWTNTGNVDYRTTTASLTFAPGETTQTFKVRPCPDTVGEGNETFNIVLTNAVNAGVGSSGEGEIRDNDAVLVYLDGDVTEVEGSDLDFTVELSAAVPHDVSVTVSTGTDLAAIHPADATAPRWDYTPLTGHTVTIPAGSLSETVSVDTVSDTTDEFDETFLLRIDSVTSAAAVIVGSPDTAVGTITDDDTEPAVTIAAASSAEDGGSLAFLVSLSHASQQTATVAVATSAGTAAGSPLCAATDGSEDYQSTTATVTFAPYATSRVFYVRVCDDTADEPNETFTVTLSSAVNASLGSPFTATGTIIDDDVTPEVSISNASADESNSITFNLMLDVASPLPVTVTAATASSSPMSAFGVTTCAAIDGSEDYQTRSSTVTFAPNTTTATFTVTVCDDTAVEGDETFTVALTSPTNATVSSTAGAATGTIVNDDSHCGDGWLYDPGHPDANAHGCRPGFVS